MKVHFNYHTDVEKDHPYFSEDFLNKNFSLFKTIIQDPQNGFFDLTEQKQYIESTFKMLEKFGHKKHFVQIGIGGSALGPQMILSALNKNDSKSFTLLDNIDSDHVAKELSKINIKESLFYVVSKSGGTAETLALYSIAQSQLLAAGVEKRNLKEYFVFCTENKDSELSQHIKDNHFETLEVPLNVGGRFSVLTHVGLFPAAFFGIDIQKLYEGANKIKKNILNEDLNQNDLLLTCSQVLALFNVAQVNQTVLMPYSSLLKDLSFWFVQLWAESLGKWCEEDQKHVGLTPIPAYGATDQHSQVQLFMEGPNDKLIMMLKVEETAQTYSLQNDIKIKRSQSLASYSLNQLMLAEYMGTLRALRENKRNVLEIIVNKVNEETVGGLIMFFECLTALVGHNLKIDPFNQPGVEKGKIYTFEYLKTL